MNALVKILIYIQFMSTVNLLLLLTVMFKQVK